MYWPHSAKTCPFRVHPGGEDALPGRTEAIASRTNQELSATGATSDPVILPEEEGPLEQVLRAAREELLGRQGGATGPAGGSPGPGRGAGAGGPAARHPGAEAQGLHHGQLVCC